jgi:hypothetical protein
MKIIIGIIVVIGLLFFLFNKKKQNPTELAFENNEPSNFYSINNGNQNELIVSMEISQKWLDSTNKKYNWNEFDEYDNKMWEYMYKFFDETVEKSGIKDYNELWNKLNREQKMFWAFLAFNGDTDNGGVYQFIFNRPEFIISVAETWDELKMDELNKDYVNVLNELSGKSSKISELKTVFNDESQDWNKRWTSFSAGYKELKSTEKIEDYYYNKEFKKKLFKRVADRIENNIDKFATIVE